MRLAAAWLVVLGLAGSAWGQWGPTIVPRDPIDPNAKLPALAFTRLRIETKVLGSLAETRTTLTIHNPHTSPVEGDLHFALPPGATVNGYALDVNGQMVDGVPVDKEEGRFIFEDIVVRQRRDPGLIEHARASEFNVRIFPIPAEGTRTVSVRYLQELPVGENGAVLEFPLRLAGRLGEASIRVEAPRCPAEPNVISGGPWPLRFARFGSEYDAQAEIEDSPAVGDVKIVIPQERTGWVRTEKAADGQFYFLIRDFPPPVKPSVLPSAKRVTILWDASGSRGSGDHEKEMEVLRRFFAAAAGGAVEVELVLFRHVADPPRRFTIEKGDASELLAELNRVAYDGGTQLGILPQPASKPPDLYLLFSDGKNTFGPVHPLDRPVYAFSSDEAPDESTLRRLAAAMGGDYFNLAKVSPAAAAAGIGKILPRMLEATSAHFISHFDIYPRGPQEMAGPVLLTGRGEASFDEVSLQYSPADGSPQVTRFQVSPAQAVPGEMLRRYWAQKKLENLLASPSPRAEEVAALGRQYSLVTPYTSLMVLETVDQYVRYRIMPPETLPDMRAEYERQIQSSAPAGESNTPLDACVGLWEARLSWARPAARVHSPSGEVPGQEPLKLTKPKAEKRPWEEGATGISGGLFSAALFNSAPSGNSASPMDEGRLPLPPRTSGSVGGPAEDGPLPLPSRARGEAPKRMQAQESPADGRRGGATRYVVDANVSCLRALAAASPDEWMGIYQATRARFGGGPTLFLETADFLLRHRHKADGVRVLSNLAEDYWDSTLLLRSQARYLVSLEMWDEAVALLEEIQSRDPDDPLVCRELALALAARAQRLIRDRPGDLNQEPRTRRRLAEADYTRAIDLLYRQAMRTRSPSDRVIFVTDLSGLIAQAKTEWLMDAYSAVDERLQKPLDVDLRVVLTGGPGGGADLEVQAPDAGEDSHAARGPHSLSNRSWGMQEYVLRKACSGIYKIQLHRWGEASPRREVVHVEVITDFGRPTEKRRSYTVLLPRQLGTYTIADVYF